MNIQTKTAASDADQYRSLRILDELSCNDTLTQRDLSRRLGIALGLVNSYVKNLVSKGFVTVKNIPRNRYAYYLTPKGFAEKTRLAYDLLSDYTRIYREAKSNFQRLFADLEREGCKNIVFAGTDEVADIAFITLQETSLQLVGVVDRDGVKIGNKFLAHEIKSLQAVENIRYDRIVITSYVHRTVLCQDLAKIVKKADCISMIFGAE